MNFLDRKILIIVQTLVFIVISCGHVIAHETEISYSITIDKQNLKLAKVKVSFVPEDDLLYMNPGGNQLPKRWATFVQNLSVVNERGVSVAVNELPDARWKMDLPDKHRVILSYEIKLDHENYKWPGGIDGIAYATDWGVFYSGRTLLIFNGKTRQDIKINFRVPEGWRVTTPWRPEGKKINSFRADNMSELANSLIFAGRHEEITFKREDFELVFALGGDETIAQKEEFKNLAEGVFDYYIDLMGGIPNPSPDNKFKKAVVIINSADTTDGEVIGNNISILVEKNGNEMSRIFSRLIFAHEFFHLWNGKSFTPTTDEAEWFKEGFTNYYTLKALRRVEFLNDQSYLQILNSLFYQRYINDDGLGAISMTKGKEKHDHWGLIYGGGMFVAIAQDLMIRKATNNQRNLDDLMKDLFIKYGGSSREYDVNEIRQKLSELNGTDQTSFFNDYIHGTKRLPIAEYFKIAGLKAEIVAGNLIVEKNDNSTNVQKDMLDGLFGMPRSKAPKEH